jgi:hypothetical protein
MIEFPSGPLIAPASKINTPPPEADSILHAAPCCARPSAIPFPHSHCHDRLTLLGLFNPLANTRQVRSRKRH